MSKAGPTKNGAGGASAASIRESAEILLKNLDKIDRKILLVGKDGKIWEKTLSPLTLDEIASIKSKVDLALQN
jgi:hypothetical protein